MSRTLDEAIRHEMNIAEKQEELAKVCIAKRAKDDCLKCAVEHRQLAEWLRELQAWRKAYDDCVNTEYESIDDSVRRLTIIGQVVNVRNVFADIRRTDDES